MTGTGARSECARIALQISKPSESGSMMSRMIRSGRSRRQSSSAPLPVCDPAMVKPSFSRLYWMSEYRSESSSINTIFFIELYLQSNGGAVTAILQFDE